MPTLFPGPGTRPGPDTISQQQVLEAGFHHVVTAGTAHYASLRRLFWADHNEIDFTNEGTIWNISADEVGSVLSGFYIMEFYNEGLIVQEATNGNANGLFVGGSGYYVENRGSIYALAKGNASAIDHWGPGVFVVNSGLLAAYASGPSDRPGGGGGLGDATSVILRNGGGLRNEADGAILAEGVTATAVLAAIASIGNFGRIEAVATGAGKLSYGISMGGYLHQHSELTNYGLIRADIAFSSYDAHPTYSPRAMDLVFNAAGGRIEGDIETGRNDDQVINDGFIQGEVRLGDGADLFDGTLGTMEGATDLGWDDDRFVGSGAGDIGKGNRGRDTLDGGLGNDLLLGGTGADRLTGGAGNDGLYGESGDDVLILAGADKAYGDAGDDRFEARDLGFALAAGGAGKDTLLFDMAGLKLDLSAIAGSGRVQSIERLELRDSQQVAVRAGDVAALAGSTLEIMGTRANQVILAGAWTEAAATVEEGGVFRTFTLGNETVLVRMGVAVTLGGVPAGFTGLAAIAGGDAAPQAGAVPGGALIDPVQAIANRHIQEAYTLIEEDETWQATTAPVIWGDGIGSVLENRGLLTMTTASGDTLYGTIQGLYLDMIVNFGTIRATATAPMGGTSAIEPFDRGRLENYGLVEATAIGNRATGAVTSYMMGDSLVLLNHGTIRATSSTGTAIGAAIGNVSQFQRDPIGVNLGLIEATGGTGTIALRSLGGGLFVNEGDIVARNTSASGAQDAIGVTLYHGVFNSSLLENRGTISGVVAIQAFGTTNAILNEGLIAGAVRLGTGFDILLNPGELRGAVSLGAGGDIYWAVSGVQQGKVSGEDGADILFGTSGADLLDGGAGDDVILGGGGADQLTGGAGGDIFGYASAGDSTAAARDTIADFVSGTDRIDLSALAAQNVTIQADGAYSLLSATTAAGTLVVRVSGTLVMGDLILTNATTITGSTEADTLLATAGGSRLVGGLGDDLLVGGAGNDVLDAGDGRNLLWGGAGDDVYMVYGFENAIVETADGGVDTIEYEASGSRLNMPDHVENAVAIITGNIIGNALANRITGSGGNDVLDGGRGDDVLIGGNGADRIVGGAGADRMTGGAGADLFVYYAVTESRDQATGAGRAKTLTDVIADFKPGEDKIDLSDLDANPRGGLTDDAFTFLGAGAFGGRTGELRATFADGIANIFADLDGDRIADLHIVAFTPAALQASDFVL
ncbi:MAG TPA: calcium-binding protein [Allosphingosinicella sp.]|nr:calcium-binding protein [Allosphingosinicella sp.]